MDKYKPPKGKLGNMHILPMQGGMVTVRERPSLGFGGKSLVQNMRCWHPCFETRPGYTALSTVATDADADSILNIYQFANGRTSDQDVFVQYGDGDLHIQNGTLPTQYTGAFGTEINNGASGQIPASFADVDDIMIYSNGANQHQFYAKEQPVERVVVVRASVAHETILGTNVTNDESTDWSGENRSANEDWNITSLADYATGYDAIYIMTKIPLDTLHVDMGTVNTNSTTVSVGYKTVSGVNNLTVDTDGTSTGGASFGQDGDIVLDSGFPQIATPTYCFGEWGYWYRISFSATLSANVTVNSIKYSTLFFPDFLYNVPYDFVDIVEAFHYDASETAYFNYAGDNIDMSLFNSSGDYLYFASSVPLEGIYIDWGSTTNTVSVVTLTLEALHHDNTGSSWQTLTQRFNSTGNFRRNGLITFGDSTSARPSQFNGTKYYAYWYRLSTNATLDDDVAMGIQGMPSYTAHLQIDQTFGSVGRTCAAWKQRACYTFDDFPSFVYVSANGQPMTLNGADFGILEAGDGRSNPVTAMVNFYNELMVFQEERGKEGGCVTLFEGYSPETWGKIVLSTKIGTFSPKTVAVVDGAKSTTTMTDVNTQTMVFFLSHYGVFMSDGKVVTAISDDIQNYFDERFTECIRKGYENEMWLAYDSTEHMIKIGIVSGTSATTCNKFFCYDLVDGVWYEDVYADSMSVFTEIEADTGNKFSIQLAGGSTSGFVYQMNTGTNDNGTAIDAKITWEFSMGPWFIDLEEILTRVKVQGDGTTYTTSVEENDVETDTVPVGNMAAERTNETIRRNRHLLKAGSVPWISFTIRNNTLDEKIYLYDMGVLAQATEHK